MNYIKHILSGFFFLAGTIISLSSCSDEESTRPGGDSRAVVFTTTVGQLTTDAKEAGPTTRLAGNSWSQGDKIGIAMLNVGDNLAATDEFKKYIAQSGASASLNPDGSGETLFYPEDGSDVNFIAFYPHATVADKKVTYNTFADQSTAALMSACDFVYSNEGTSFNSETQTATLNFDHKLSKLVVNVKTSSDDDAIDLSKISVTIDGMPGKIEADLSDGSIIVSESVTITPYAPADGVSATAYSAQAVVASHLAADYTARKVVFTYKDGSDEKVASSAISTTLDFKSGKVYELNFTLTAKGDVVEVEPKGVTISDWTGGTWTYSYTVDTPKEITIAAAADEYECTFKTNYTGSVSLIYSTSANDPHAGIPSWITVEQAPTGSTADSNGNITYTYKFSAVDNESEDEQMAYLHLNVEKINVVIAVMQKAKVLLPNSYMLKPGEDVLIPVVRANEFTALVGEPNAIGDADVFTTKVLWSDVQDLVTVQTEGTGKTGGIKVTAAVGKSGNAMIAAMVSDKIVWSWHIWVTDYAPNPETDTWMDRNLGAVNATRSAAGSTGLYYQWGRKDPFPGSSKATSGTEPMLYNADGISFTYSMSESIVTELGYPTRETEQQTMAWTVNNPLTFIVNNNNGSWMINSDFKDTNWNTADNKKTIFDPCPEGYRVPKEGAWGGSDDFKNSFPWISNGRNTGSVYGGWYPAAGCRLYNTGGLSVVNSTGRYWSRISSSILGGWSLFFNSSSVTATLSYFRPSGMPVRCIAEPN